MAKYSPENCRNIALVGGPDSGKTSLTDALLFKGGAVTRLGKVNDGTSVSDYDPEEKDKKHSLNLSIIHLTHKKLIEQNGPTTILAGSLAGPVESGRVIKIVVCFGAEFFYCCEIFYCGYAALNSTLRPVRVYEAIGPNNISRCQPVFFLWLDFVLPFPRRLCLLTRGV